MGFFKPNIKKMQEGEDLPGLVKALSHDNHDVRLSAAKALIQLGVNGSNPEIRNQAFEEVHSAAENEEQRICAVTIEALQIMSEQIPGSAFPFIIRAALMGNLNHPSQYVRENAAKTLGNLGHANAIEPILRAQQETDERVRNA